METDGPRSVFISYSWDNDKHKAWVRKLASRLVRAGIKPGPKCAVPTHFSGIYAIDMRKATQYSGAVKALLSAIYEQPLIAPPKLGSRFKRRDDRAAKNKKYRLPIMELDGWRLVSGVAMNQEPLGRLKFHPRARAKNLKRVTSSNSSLTLHYLIRKNLGDCRRSACGSK
jgi:SEFIR domain